uniref:Ribosomal protein L1 n=1 Tax=Mantoniella antarctica TaxID=81844 RepID=A0A7S0S7C7_9CHLO|mmetsp:Transcript_41653/g.66869  ORF Transcript_41653/g.66869 Transcript_41653/m.66869 type:complete len:306 (-) Transcript_41653:266-1183(-)
MAPAAAASASRVDPAQVAKAVAALTTHIEKVRSEGKSQLFDEDGDGDTYNLMISMRKVPAKGSNKLVPIAIPHPLLNLDVAEVCLIVKDHLGEGHKDAKKRVAAMEKCGVAKVLGISKLRNNYKPHEAKRKLCDSYDLFCADARVLPLLPKLLGKTFFKKKRQPVPVDLTKKDWPAQIRKAAAATYVHMGAGTCISVKVGKSAQSQAEVVANALAAIAGAVEVIPRKWANVQCIYMKTIESVALPIYNAMPEPEEATPEEANAAGEEANAAGEATTAAAKAGVEGGEGKAKAKPKSKVKAKAKAK